MRSDGGRFSLLEPATPPVRAISPQRRRIVALGVMAGLGLGLGVIVLLELLNKTIRRPAELAQLLQSQPLATIPTIRPPSKTQFPNYRRHIAAMLVMGRAAVVADRMARYRSTVSVMPSLKAGQGWMSLLSP